MEVNINMMCLDPEPGTHLEHAYLPKPDQDVILPTAKVTNASLIGEVVQRAGCAKAGASRTGVRMPADPSAWSARPRPGCTEVDRRRQSA